LSKQKCPNFKDSVVLGLHPCFCFQVVGDDFGGSLVTATFYVDPTQSRLQLWIPNTKGLSKIAAKNRTALAVNPGSELQQTYGATKPN